MALAVQKRGRAASQQELTTATTLLTTVGQLVQHGRPNRIRAASTRHDSSPAHSERVSPRNRRMTAHVYLDAKAHLRLGKE